MSLEAEINNSNNNAGNNNISNINTISNFLAAQKKQRLDNEKEKF